MDLDEAGEHANAGRMTAKRERILVFHPLYTLGAKFDYRMLGMQHWITDQLGVVGLEGASLVFTKPGDGPVKMTASEPPTDGQIRETLVQHESRYGLLSTFAVLGSSPHLAVARLVEVRRGHPLRILGRWTFDGDTHQFPVAAHGLFVLVATRLGAQFKPHAWSDLFGTTDVVAASNFLTAVGCYASCDRGIAIDEPETALRAALSGIAAGMAPAVEFLPHLVESLRASSSAEEGMLTAAVSAAAELVGAVPDAWRPMMRELGIAGGPAN